MWSLSRIGDNKGNSVNPTESKPLSPPFIAIGIPHVETVTMQWAFQSLGPLLYTPTNFCIKLPLFARGIPQNLARDQIVQMMLQDRRFTHILWIDTDNVAESPKDPNEALRLLLGTGQDIVSGLYRAKQAQGFNYAAWMDAKLGKPGFYPISSIGGGINLFTVDVVGMGFCLVRRSVYEIVPPPWHPWDTPQPSEDFRFMMKAKGYGFPTWVYSEVKIGHIGSLEVHNDGRVTTLEV